MLDGRVAIITGGARGQGASHARRFVAEGAEVLIADVRREEGEALSAELGEAARFGELDVTDEASWTAAVADAVAAFGPPTALVNNAGIIRNSLLVEEDTEHWNRVLDVNLTGAWLGIRAVAPGMRAAGGGAIVNISSTAGLVGYARVGAYTASKWGLRGLTKTAALELSPQGIRVNSVHPGVIDTPMLTYDASDNSRFASQPIPRAGQPEEITAAVTFLCSDEASYITGAELAVDGGMVAGEVPPSSRPTAD